MKDKDIKTIWYKANKYELVDAPKPEGVPDRLSDFYRCIKPSPDAIINSYPMIFNQKSKALDTIKPVALDDLLKINLNDHQDILQFVQESGLLGILPARLASVRLAATLTLEPGTRPSMTQVTYSCNCGWNRVENHITLAGNITTQNVGGRTVLDSEGTDPIKLNGYERRGAIARHIFGIEYHETTLTNCLSPYFPNVPKNETETWNYPLPLSTEFWMQYGESIGEIRMVIHNFRTMIEKLGELPLPSESTLEDYSGIPMAGFCALATNYPTFSNDNRTEPQLMFNSLLGIHAFSIWKYLTSGLELRNCNRTRCRKLYFTSSSTKVYCSSRCRQAQEKIRQRGR